MCELPGEAIIEPGVTVGAFSAAGSGVLVGEQADKRNSPAVIINLGHRIFIKGGPPWVLNNILSQA
mgnify:CR=1 FL=1